MKGISRRDVLKTGLLAPAAAAVVQGAGPWHAVAQAADHTAGGASDAAAAPMVAGRDRQLLDFGWRFHFGDANDYTRDFDFGSAG
ncbi:MAG: twin-arginine translocation signal domain-containing protein, partial [Acidobacteriota bacterium]|nr:twin-arginine translocation signal domain-containing protein [Acidobacteriota bacterium]